MAKRRCMVPICKKTDKTHPHKLFLRVPSNKQRQKLWAAVLKIPSLNCCGSAYICEDHFNLSEDCANWIQYKTMGRYIILKPHVKPHKFLTETCPESKSQLTDCEKKKRRSFLEHFKSTPPSVASVEETSAGKKKKTDEVSSPSRVSKPIQTQRKISFLEFVKSTSPATVEETFVGKKKKTGEVSSPSEVFVVKHTEKQKKNKNLECLQQTSQAVGEKNKNDEVLPQSPVEMPKLIWHKDVTSNIGEKSEIGVEEEGFKEMRRKSTLSLIQMNPRFYLGLSKETYILTSFLTRWTDVTYMDVLITLKKIRLGDSFFRLANDFGVDASTISETFSRSVPKLADSFQNFIISPDVMTVKKNLPITFRYRYSDVYNIIHYLEIGIENELKKYLISCTPDGVINFVSGGFGGQTSETDIVIEIINIYKYIDSLPENVSVMADGDFEQISGLLSGKNCKLVRAPSLPSNEHIKESKQIAALRIHIERVIRRLVEFEGLRLHPVVDHQLLGLLDCMIIIACGIINLQDSLL